MFQIEANFETQEVIIVQSTSAPAQDHLLELLFIADTAKQAGANHVTAVIPYFGYGRQDQPTRPFGFTPVSLVARLLEAAGIDKVISLDLHSRQIENFFKIEIKNLNSLSLFGSFLGDTSDCVGSVS